MQPLMEFGIVQKPCLECTLLTQLFVYNVPPLSCQTLEVSGLFFSIFIFFKKKKKLFGHTQLECLDIPPLLLVLQCNTSLLSGTIFFPKIHPFFQLSTQSSLDMSSKIIKHFLAQNFLRRQRYISGLFHEWEMLSKSS